MVVNEVKRGLYLDSVALMRASRSIAGLEGVEEAALMMGTPANLAIMRDAGILGTEGESACASDLVVAVRARNRTAAEAAIAEAARLLTRPQSDARGQTWRPRSLRQAVKLRPEANLALISVPGAFATAEARKAIRRGLDAMIFSDNVPISEERALKEEARALGRLVMGPDCGTAIIAGTPLAFANAVPQGDVGIVGASGTGTQEVSCLIARAGGGISHALGVGGRDLSEAVGGLSTLAALAMLETDSKTRHIVLISKPPGPETARRVLERMAECSKTFTTCFMGADAMEMPRNTCQVFTLRAAAARALGQEVLGPAPVEVRPDKASGRRVVGLFSGGTLAAEAQVVFRAAGETVISNAPIPGAGTLGGQGHEMLDLGSDEYTQGRPHPMIDPGVRDAALARTLADSKVGAVLVDVVIGYGAHPDPAGHLAQAVAAAGDGHAPVVASVTGTEDDPQRRSAQVAKLEAAGIMVAPSNAEAAALALATARGGP